MKNPFKFKKLKDQTEKELKNQIKANKILIIMFGVVCLIVTLGEMGKYYIWGGSNLSLWLGIINLVLLVMVLTVMDSAVVFWELRFRKLEENLK